MGIVTLAIEAQAVTGICRHFRKRMAHLEAAQGIPPGEHPLGQYAFLGRHGKGVFPVLHQLFVVGLPPHAVQARRVGAQHFYQQRICPEHEPGTVGRRAGEGYLQVPGSGHRPAQVEGFGFVRRRSRFRIPHFPAEARRVGRVDDDGCIFQVQGRPFPHLRVPRADLHGHGIYRTGPEPPNRQPGQQQQGQQQPARRSLQTSTLPPTPLARRSLQASTPLRLRLALPLKLLKNPVEQPLLLRRARHVRREQVLQLVPAAEVRAALLLQHAPEAEAAGRVHRKAGRFQAVEEEGEGEGGMVVFVVNSSCFICVFAIFDSDLRSQASMTRCGVISQSPTGVNRLFWRYTQVWRLARYAALRNHQLVR